MGRHARRTGSWFNPVPWSIALAAITWLLTLLRHAPCQQEQAGEPVDAFLRLCYSDIPLVYQNTSVGTGGWPMRDASIEVSPLAGLFIALVRVFADLVGAEPAFGVPAQQLVDGAHLFFLCAAVLLFCCFLVTVACTALVGRGSGLGSATTIRGRGRSWDALFVAGSPAVVAGGLVSWDMFAVCLTMTALLAWSLRRTTVCAVLLGLAITASPMAILVLVALHLLCRRAGRLSVWAGVAGKSLTLAGLLALGMELAWPGAASNVPSTWLAQEPDLGSIWFVLDALGVELPGFSLVVAALALSWLVWVAHRVARAPRRPRLAQVLFLLVTGWFLVGKGFAPQQVLWLVPLVALARPRLSDWALWSLAEVLYCWSVWGHLGGQLAPADGGPDVLYWAAVLLRWVALVWLVRRVTHDMQYPWEDPVREPHVDDPLGGVLDHCPDRTRRVDAPGLSLMDEDFGAFP